MVAQPFKVQLQGPVPLFMDCQNVKSTNNGFYGKQYFYNFLSASGTYKSLDKISYYLWFNVHSKNILTGRQVLFSFVDGYGLDSALNLMVYYQKDKQNQYYLSISNDKISPEIKKLDLNQANDLYKGFWNYILISIDQTTGDLFINIKFFSTYDQQLQQIRDVLPQQKFVYSFGPHSRITNEQLYNQTSDYKACVKIANFYYINGWSTMDSEIHVDYFSDLKFLLRPYSTSLNYDTAQLSKTTQQVIFSGSVGISVYKNTQIVYSFTEQFGSFTIGFWMKTKNIASDFQILSLTDDLVEKTCIGFGVDKWNNLLLYQLFAKQQIGIVEDEKWQHITAAVLEISLDQNFAATSQTKYLRVLLNSTEIYSQNLKNFLAYKRVVIGPLKTDTKRLEMIDIQDIKIFNGFGVVLSNTDCQLFVGEFCLFCKEGTHYCTEQDPTNDLKIYKCPAGYKDTSSGCQSITQLNCLRVSNANVCTTCKDGYNLVSGQCISNSLYVYNPYSCQDPDAIYCEQIINKIVIANSVTNIATLKSDISQISKLCKLKNKYYDPITLTCKINEVANCQQSQYLSNCYKCLDKFYVTSQKQCQISCAINSVLKFRDSDITNNLCIQYCPKRYSFAFTCDTGSGISDYSCDSRDSCGIEELDLKYLCVKSQYKTIGKSEMCKITPIGTIITSSFDCKPICKYCYGQQNSQCLGCYDGYYFSPYLSTCLKKCSDKQNRFLFHNTLTMVCEFVCPQTLLTQGKFCVQQCNDGYAKFQNKCILITSVEVYLDQNLQQMKLCPELCLTCSNSTTCLTCINSYPFFNGQCVFDCYPSIIGYKNNQYICKDACDSDDLLYENPDFQGYSIKQCFYLACGKIQAGGVYQTFRHQTNTKVCTLPCDDGYYGDTNSFQCMKCADTCFTCQNYENFCTQCYPSIFLLNNACFENCGDKYSNYITFECEGSCSEGFSLTDSSEGIKACVPQCGDIFPDYIYKQDGNCVKTPPNESVYCDGLNCYSCSPTCKNCSGQLDTDCTECYENYFLNSGSCLLDCGVLKYDKINWLCVSTCPNGLYESTGEETINDSLLTITSCFITCLYGKYQFKGKCYDSKPDNCYCESRTNYIYCEKCSEQCLTCTTAYSNSCSICNIKAFLLNTDCYYDCPNEAPLKDLTTHKCVDQCQYYSQDGYCVYNCDSNTVIDQAKKACYQFGCPLGTYNQGSTKYCYACYAGCSSCLDGTNNNCQSCFDGYFLDRGKSCTKKCQNNPNLLQDWINGVCSQYCPLGSFLQQLSDGSLACKDFCPLYYYSNICVSECPNQSYLQGVKCLSCAGPCSVCYGTEVDQCTECDQGYYKDGTTCYQQCPALKPYINIVDQTCIQNCQDYLYLSKMICFTECPSYLYIYELNGIKECVEQCYSKSYLENGQCLDCDPICKQCFGPNNGNCVECEQPYYLNLQTCQMTCPQFYDTVDNACREACPVNLVAQEQLCQQKCDEGYLVYNQNCLNECPSFTYIKNLECFDCNLVCSKCFGGSENECSECIDNYFLNGNTCQLNCSNIYDLEDKKCKDNCDDKLELTDLKQCVTNCPEDYIKCDSECVKMAPDGYYSDGTQCQKCNDKCLKCESSTICTECKKNYYLDNNQCENSCTNKYLFMDILSKTCVTKCPSKFYHLESFDKRFCVSDCKHNLDNWCVDDCPEGTYTENKVCKSCANGCLECQSSTICNKCLGGYYSENGQCLTSCLVNKTDRVNIQCVKECDNTLYTYNDECLSECPTAPLTFEYEMSCLTLCPDGTYLDGQKCKDCDLSCSSCIGPTNNDCYECANGYYLEDQVCTETCPNFYDTVNLICVMTCPIGMFEESDKCVSKCQSFQYKNSCVTDCPLQTYKANLQCIDCSNNCEECNSFGCLKCFNSTYLLDGLCESTCPVFYDDTNNQCVERCPDKTLQFLDNCYSECPQNTYELNSECQLSCPKYMVPKIKICVNCPERCSECLDDTICSICLKSYYLYEGQCYVSCPLTMPYAHIQQGVCLSQCNPDTFIKGFECVAQCNLITYQNQCLNKCPSGYYGQDFCKPCRLECKECTNYDICTICNDNYFLEYNQCDIQCTKIKDLEKKQCVDTCDKLLYKNVCYQECPDNTYQFGSICVLNCIDGYYGSDQWKCVQCPKQCSLCSQETLCSKCNTGFYLYQTDCLTECPQLLFSDPIQNKCSSSCPKRTYQYQHQCLFDCPDEYYKDDESFICVENCSSQQYLSKKTCYQCSIECDGCFAYGNNNCIKCLTNYKLDENGFCIGSSCKTGYYLQNQACQKCQHKCLTCQNQLECTKCRGTNRSQNDCQCAKGYYDDELNDDCQKCPCDECTSQTNCLICKNNLQLPLCACDRKLNEDWCITCEIAKVNIHFSDDLNSIIVYFGYLVAANLINPFQPSDCSLWFDNSEVFGLNATCYLSWDRYSIVIELKPYSTVKVGDNLNFKEKFYRDIDQGVCGYTFIQTFIENKVNNPSTLQKPYILFSVPSFVSACKLVEVKQILYDGTGQRLQQVLNWQLEEIDNEDAYLQMDSFLQQQKNEMNIPIGILLPNTTYKITAKYINMFERVNFTVFSFTTLAIQAPYVFLTFNPLKANVYVFDCHVSFKDMENSFTIQIDILDSMNETKVLISQQEQINPLYEITLNESLLPKQQPLLFVASTASSIIKEVFVLQSKNIDIQFLQPNRFIGQDNKINPRGYDRNINDEMLSTKNIKYDWLCTNLNDLQPCKTDENQIIQFSSNRVVDIFADSQNITLVFYVKASKDNRWTVREQFIVISNFNIEEEFVLNEDQEPNYINPNDEITIVIKNNQQYAFVMQEFKVLSSQKINGKTVKFRLADLSLDLKSHIQIYLLPGKESIAFQFNDPPEKIIFSITPLEGKSLDYFNYTIQNLKGSKANIYYYFSNTTLTNDILQLQTLNGIPLVIETTQMEGAFQLPNGISNNEISLLCVIETVYGAKSFFTQQIQVVRQNYELSTLISTFSNKTNFSDLNSLHTMTSQIQLEQQQVCLKQCSGVGTCINYKCECPPEYYFDDCSGSQDDYQNYLSIINSSIVNLMKQSISNNDNFKLFSQSLLFFSQFTELIQSLTTEQCQNILQQYVSNTNSRLMEINQYQINLQYHSTQDYNYSEIDIRSIANNDELYLALNSTIFMWNRTLFTQDSSIYLLQNYMKQFISNIIDLSIASLAIESTTNLNIDTARINIIKTSDFTKYVNFTNQSSVRLLAEQLTNDTSYDIVLSVYLRNFYAYDGYFPYPDQLYPLYDYQIRYSNRKENILLQNAIFYKFKILNNSKNLVCLSRNDKTYYWTEEYCLLDYIDQIYYCNCSILAPTTIVNDLKFSYQGVAPSLINLPNILLLVYGIQVILVIAVAIKANINSADSQVGPSENFKYGKVIGLMKHRGMPSFGESNTSVEYKNLPLSKDVREKKDVEQKLFNFNSFWKQHFLSRLVQKELPYLSLFFRSILIIIRYHLILIIAEILEIYLKDNSILVNVCILIGSIIIIRILEKFYQKQIKQSSVLQYQVLVLVYKFFILLLFAISLLILIYFYLQLENQTTIIISYTILFLCDLLLLDVIQFTLNKFLGEGKKKIIKDKVQLFSKIKDITISD